MKRKLTALFLALAMAAALLPAAVVSAASDASNGDWSAKTVTLNNTGEAELTVRAGDIDALNDSGAIANGYNPFTAKDQRGHGYPWALDATDPQGTDRIYVGSRWNGATYDGYSSCYSSYKSGGDTQNAYGDGALTITMNYNLSGVSVKNVLLQLCIDDFQALSHGSNFTVTLNGKDAPFIAELLNQVDQSGPTSYMISAVIPSGFYSDISSGKFAVTIDETTGVGDGYAVDFAKLLINYNPNLFTGQFSGNTEPGATVRLLGTSTTVTAGSDGNFTFKAVPGLNAVRASKSGFTENYAFGIVLSSETEWNPTVTLSAGAGSPDIDFSKFAATGAWANASAWATPELQKAADMGLIPASLNGADLTKPITRAEFAAVSVKAYENLTGKTTSPASSNPFTDTKDAEVLKAYNVGITAGTGATTFDPNTVLNREQAAAMLTRVLKAAYIPGWTLATDGNFTLNFTQPAKFADDASISGWAKPSVYFMAANGIIAGVGSNTFAPKNTTSAQEAAGYANATREQAIVIAARMVGNLKGKNLDYGKNQQAAAPTPAPAAKTGGGLTLAALRQAAKDTGYEVSDDYVASILADVEPIGGFEVTFTKGGEFHLQFFEFASEADAQAYKASEDAPNALFPEEYIIHGRFLGEVVGGFSAAKDADIRAFVTGVFTAAINKSSAAGTAPAPQATPKPAAQAGVDANILGKWRFESSDVPYGDEYPAIAEYTFNADGTFGYRSTYIGYEDFTGKYSASIGKITFTDIRSQLVGVNGGNYDGVSWDKVVAEYKYGAGSGGEYLQIAALDQDDSPSYYDLSSALTLSRPK